MSPDELRNLVSDSRYISGIYNYCDRWCVRCPLSHRCLNYAMETSEETGESPEPNMEQRQFWTNLQERFTATLQVLQQEAERRGIDLDAPEAKAAAALHEERVRQRVAQDEFLERMGHDYAVAVAAWLERSEPWFLDKGAEWLSEARLGVGQPTEAVAALQDALEVIRWYQHFIGVKLSRAIGSNAERDLENSPEYKAVMRDGDGSAKIALIAMDRSLAAWNVIRGQLPEEAGDSVLDLQVSLARMRAAAEKLFPNARAFIRPGFDEDLARLERG